MAWDQSLTISEPLETTLKDGTVIQGKIWMHPSRKGNFEVEYQGARKTDARTDYTSEGHMRSIAKIILQEMAEDPKFSHRG